MWGWGIPNLHSDLSFADSHSSHPQGDQALGKWLKHDIALPTSEFTMEAVFGSINKILCLYQAFHLSECLI